MKRVWMVTVAGMLAAQGAWANLADVAAAVDAVRADASKRAGIAPAQVQVVSAEAVTWRDGRLGCPRADALYSLALVPGYRVRVKAGAQASDYHVSQRGALVVCPPESSQDPLPAKR